MKNLQTLATAFILTAGIAANAAPVNPNKPLAEKRVTTTSFSRIVVENGIDLVLTESSDQSINISGHDEAVNKVDWKIKGRTLYIKSREGSLKNQVVLNISMSGLQAISILGNSEVSTRGQLRSKSIDLYMEGTGKAAIKNSGAIYVVEGDGTRLDVRKAKGDVWFK